MRTYLVSCAKRDGTHSLVELPGAMKLLLWLLLRIRDSIHIHITIGINGDYNLMVESSVDEEGGTDAM